MRYTGPRSCTVAAARAGAINAWVALCLPVIIGIAAIVVDGGRMMEERRHVQAATDAAALAAGAALYADYWTYQGKDTAGSARTAAIQSAAANGYAASDVTVNIPPTSGTYANQSGYAEVIIKSNLAASFGKLFTRNDVSISGRTVARGQPMKLGIIALKSSGAGTFQNNALALAIINTPLIVNSSDSAAYDQASLGAVVASQIDVTGNYVNPGGAIMLTKVRTGVPPTPDPLGYLAVPDSAGSPVRSSKALVINSLLPTTLQPGVYQGGIDIKGISIVTMNPGTYIMQGGGFKVEGTATVAGVSVFIYNTFDATHAAGPISITSLGKVALTAPLSGTYQGINFFQNRSQTTPITMKGVGLAAITGVIYAAGAPANLTGSAAVGVDILGGAYVVSTMTVGGVGGININLGLNPPRVPDVRIVE